MMRFSTTPHMLRGMTAFGRQVKETSWGRLTIELSSLNRRHFELRCQLPAQLHAFEPLVRQEIAKQISRGALTLTVRLSQYRLTLMNLNSVLLSQIAKTATQMANVLDHPRERCVDLLFVAMQHQLLGHEEESDTLDAFRPFFLEALEETLSSLQLMKAAEGETLGQDLRQRCSAMQRSVGCIEKLLPGVMERTRLRLREAVGELLRGDEGRLGEVQLYADRSDVTEELVRLKAHLEQLQAALVSTQSVSGRDLEFRLQELLREANTLGAKTADTEVIEQLLLMKSEMERIRQQVQNIE